MWVDAREPNERAIDEAVHTLESGQLLVAPTETRYGLLARSDSDDAMEQLMRAKGRAAGAPVAIFARDETQMGSFGEMNEAAQALARRYLPGPLTLVLKARGGWKAPIVVDEKVGVRWSSSPVIRAIVDRLSVPVTATSANLSGAPECSRIGEIASQLRYNVALYLDAGELANPVSTVVDCTGETVRVLRTGAIPETAIADTVKAGPRV